MKTYYVNGVQDYLNTRHYVEIAHETCIITEDNHSFWYFIEGKYVDKEVFEQRCE